MVSLKDYPMFMSTEQVAEALGTNQASVRRAIKDGRLIADKVGGGYRVCRELLPEDMKLPSLKKDAWEQRGGGQGEPDGAMTLKKLRRGAGYRSARDFAEDVGLPPSTYARYEREMHSIPMDKLLKLADWFGVPMDWIVGRECPCWVERGAQQELYDLLSPRGKAEVERFIAYQMFLDGKGVRDDG